MRNFLKENIPFDFEFNKFSTVLYTNKELEERLLNTFDENYTVKQNANSELKGLYSSLRDTELNLRKTVQDLMNSTNKAMIILETY